MVLTVKRDGVVAEWKKIKEEMSLEVHCYVSGSDILQDLVAGFRYHIFSKELPLVSKAVVVHGDSLLFRKHPELLEAKVWVYFHSRLKKYNRVECRGPLKDATQTTFDDGFDAFQTSVFDSIGKTILHTLGRQAGEERQPCIYLNAVIGSSMSSTHDHRGGFMLPPLDATLLIFSSRERIESFNQKPNLVDGSFSK